MSINEKWLSILEYAADKQTSISTIRRKIKSKKLKSKQIDGKYFIKVDAALNTQLLPATLSKKEIKLSLENKRLKQLLSQKEEEINDLQMLVSIYEGVEKKPSLLPELPLA
ncbi:MAG: hypothetical protein HN576_17040 [Bacteriovoracaceae bacterium]|jgi:hypothetical protein|nr:hypothetical protein [Bacteriovoracaceae bacterium]